MLKFIETGNVPDVLFYKMEEDNSFIIKDNLKTKQENKGGLIAHHYVFNGFNALLLL